MRLLSLAMGLVIGCALPRPEGDPADKSTHGEVIVLEIDDCVVDWARHQRAPDGQPIGEPTSSRFRYALAAVQRALNARSPATVTYDFRFPPADDAASEDLSRAFDDAPMPLVLSRSSDDIDATVYRSREQQLLSHPSIVPIRCDSGACFAVPLGGAYPAQAEPLPQSLATFAAWRMRAQSKADASDQATWAFGRQAEWLIGERGQRMTGLPVEGVASFRNGYSARCVLDGEGSSSCSPSRLGCDGLHLDDAVVVVGGSWTGNPDMLPIEPTSDRLYPGVYAHAAVVQAVLDASDWSAPDFVSHDMGDDPFTCFQQDVAPAGLGTVESSPCPVDIIDAVHTARGRLVRFGAGSGVVWSRCTQGSSPCEPGMGIVIGAAHSLGGGAFGSGAEGIDAFVDIPRAELGAFGLDLVRADGHDSHRHRFALTFHPQIPPGRYSGSFRSLDPRYDFYIAGVDGQARTRNSSAPFEEGLELYDPAGATLGSHPHGDAVADEHVLIAGFPGFGNGRAMAFTSGRVLDEASAHAVIEALRVAGDELGDFPYAPHAEVVLEVDGSLTASKLRGVSGGGVFNRRGAFVATPVRVSSVAVGPRQYLRAVRTTFIASQLQQVLDQQGNASTRRFFGALTR